MALLNNPRRALAALDARAGLPGFGAPLLGGFTFDERRRKKEAGGGRDVPNPAELAARCCAEAEADCCRPDDYFCRFTCRQNPSNGSCTYTCARSEGDPRRSLAAMADRRSS
jgi:hypothetical protein